MGADAVELDVFLIKDGELVVFHGGVSCVMSLHCGPRSSSENHFFLFFF